MEENKVCTCCGRTIHDLKNGCCQYCGERIDVDDVKTKRIKEQEKEENRVRMSFFYCHLKKYAIASMVSFILLFVFIAGMGVIFYLNFTMEDFMQKYIAYVIAFIAIILVLLLVFHILSLLSLRNMARVNPYLNLLWHSSPNPIRILLFWIIGDVRFSNLPYEYSVDLDTSYVVASPPDDGYFTDGIISEFQDSEDEPSPARKLGGCYNGIFSVTFAILTVICIIMEIIGAFLPGNSYSGNGDASNYTFAYILFCFMGIILLLIIVMGILRLLFLIFSLKEIRKQF